jgi:outer membrane protein TolC
LAPVTKIGLRSTLLTAALLACTAGCTVGPGYKRPTAQIPDTWKGEGPWQTAAPKDAIPKGAWWQIFHDAELDRLEQDLLHANQSLIAARDRLFQARAQARIASSAYFPVVSADPNGQRQRLSGNRPLDGGTIQTVKTDTENEFTVPFSVNYELDLFGRVRRNLEAANASLQGSAADLENVRLVLSAELAADYFNLRELDREAGVVRESVEIQQKDWIWSTIVTKAASRMGWKWRNRRRCSIRRRRSFSSCCSSGRNTNMPSPC